MTLRPTKPLCRDCTIYRMSHVEAMCRDCSHVGCGWHCTVTEQPIKPDQPPCMEWDCGNWSKCKRALLIGIEKGGAALDGLKE